MCCAALLPAGAKLSSPPDSSSSSSNKIKIGMILLRRSVPVPGTRDKGAQHDGVVVYAVSTCTRILGIFHPANNSWRTCCMQWLCVS